ncbi:hypothetical protein GCM10027262_21530 [Nocardia tengchongensis]
MGAQQFLALSGLMQVDVGVDGFGRPGVGGRIQLSGHTGLLRQRTRRVPWWVGTVGGRFAAVVPSIRSGEPHRRIVAQDTELPAVRGTGREHTRVYVSVSFPA